METYVSREIAEKLNKLNFKWGYSGNSEFYPEDGFEDCPDGIWAPRLDVAQRWLREVKHYHICVQPVNTEVDKETHKCNIAYDVLLYVDNNSRGGVDFVEMLEIFETYEDAIEAGIKKCLTLILED